MNRIIKNKDGMTLIEILVTIAIIMVIIIPLSFLIIYSAKNNSKSEIQLNATALSQKYMETVKSWDILDVNYTLTDNKYIYQYQDNEYKTVVTLTEDENYKNQQQNLENVDYALLIKSDDNFINFISNGVVVLPPIIKSDRLSICFSSNKLKINDLEPVSFSYTDMGYTTIGVEINQNITIDIRNDSQKTIYMDIIRSRENIYSCKLNILNGNIVKRENVYDTPIVKNEDSILYKVEINVYFKEENVLSIEGYKVFD